MDTLFGLLAAFGTAASKSATDITTKIAARGMSERRLLAIQWAATAVILCAVAVVWYPTLLIDPLHTLATLTTSDVWWLLVLDGGLNAVSFYFYIRAFKYSDASLVAPMMLFTPVILLVTSPLMLGEHVPFLGIIGVLFTVAGSYLMGFSIENLRTGKLLAPFLALTRDKGVRSMLVTSIIWGVTSNLDKMGVRASTPVLWSALISITIAFYSCTFWLAMQKRSPHEEPHGWRALLPGTTNAAGTLLQMYAIAMMYVPYVIAIKRMSSILTVLTSKVVFGEKIGARMFGTMVMLAGVVLIAIAS
jgi:uncharacterized membrane protein